MSINFLNVVLFLAAAQGLLLSVLIFQKYRRLFANRFLGSMMFFYSLILFQMLLTDLQFDRKYPHVMLVVLGIPFLMGPLHLLYTKSIVQSSRKFALKDWLHFIPFFVFEISIIPALFKPASELTASQQAIYTEGMSFSAMLFNWLILVQIVTYLVLTLAIIHRYTKRIKNLFSTIEKIKLDWIRNISLMAIFVVAMFFLENTFFLVGVSLSHFFNLTSILFAVFVYTMGYMGLSRSEIFATPEISQTIGQLPNSEFSDPAGQNFTSPKYEKSGLTREKAMDYLNQLLQIMEIEKPYRDSELTLGQLAEKISISPHNLSEILNTQLNQNFFDFVNNYRVEEAKQNLVDPAKQNIKILSIAFDAGFNSKTTFNTIFKKQTKLTPSEFRSRATK